jgi:Coenzyme PQQ synthesis protein D (PqqD)
VSQMSQRYGVNPKIVNETIDGEVIMLNLDRGRYYSLTRSGAEAWDALRNLATPAEIVDHLHGHYAAERSEIEAAVRRLVDDLCREELIAPLADGTGAPAAIANGRHNGTRAPFEAPRLQVYTDMEDLLMLDPIHEVDETGWPSRPAGPAPTA